MLSSNHHFSLYTKLMTVLNKEDWQSMKKSMNHHHLSLYRKLTKSGFHSQQTPRPQHKKQSDYVLEQSSFPQNRFVLAQNWQSMK